jgi:hypothetical protein
MLPLRWPRSGRLRIGKYWHHIAASHDMRSTPDRRSGTGTVNKQREGDTEFNFCFSKSKIDGANRKAAFQ